MSKEKGFTLIELMITIAILGTLAATAIPFYRTWIDRARGAEAVIMVKQIIDAQIIYYLEKNDFFPAEGEAIDIPSEGELSPQQKQYLDEIKQKLNIVIPRGRKLDYGLLTWLEDGQKVFNVSIMSSLETGIFSGGNIGIIGRVNEKGEMEIFFSTGG